MELEQAVGHHGEVGHHVVLAEETAERLHHLGHVGVGRVHQLVELAFGLLAPMPRVFKRRDLRGAVILGRAALLRRLSAAPADRQVSPTTNGRFEEEVVVALGIERRVEVDEVNGFVLDVLAEHHQVVAEEELIHVAQSRKAAVTGQPPL